MHLSLTCRSFDWLQAGSQRRSYALQLSQPEHRLFAGVAAHLGGGLQAGAEGWAVGVAEDLAAFILAQLYAAHTGGLAVRHTGNRAGDGGGDAAGAAAVTACGHGLLEKVSRSAGVCLFCGLPARCSMRSCTCGYPL